MNAARKSCTPDIQAHAIVEREEDAIDALTAFGQLSARSTTYQANNRSASGLGVLAALAASLVLVVLLAVVMRNANRGGKPVAKNGATEKRIGDGVKPGAPKNGLPKETGSSLKSKNATPPAPVPREDIEPVQKGDDELTRQADAPKTDKENAGAPSALGASTTPQAPNGGADKTARPVAAVPEKRLDQLVAAKIDEPEFLLLAIGDLFRNDGPRLEQMNTSAGPGENLKNWRVALAKQGHSPFPARACRAVPGLADARA